MIRSAIRHRTQEWAEEETSRVCGIIVQSNLGILDQILSNQTELLDLLTPQQLSLSDDIGVTPAYQAVFYDRPGIVQYLHNRGVDLAQPCDPANYGNPMFYAVSMKKYRVVEMLDRIGYSVADPCNSLDELPMAHARRLDDPIMTKIIEHCIVRKKKIAEMFYKNYLRSKCRRRYLTMRQAAITLQAFLRKHRQPRAG
jgi:hypothetical protein